MKHLKMVEQIPSVDVLKTMEKPYVLLEEGTNSLQYNYIWRKNPKYTQWYNGEELIKELDVVGELTSSYKEVSATRCEIGTNVTSIGSYAFQDCSSLTSVEIPNSVTSIGNNAFMRCSKLTSIAIPNSVASISNSTFAACSNLTSVTIPNSVTSIGGTIFTACRRLTSISYEGTMEQWNAITKDINWILNGPTTCQVHCTDGDIAI